MKQDEHWTARSILKRWSKRNPTVELQWAQPKTEHRAPTNLIESVKAGAFITSEARPAGEQIKRAAKLLTVTGLTTKHAVFRITFLYPILFIVNDYFSKLNRKNHAVQQFF